MISATSKTNDAPVGPATGEPVPIKDLLAAMKAWRGGRATRHLLQAAGDAYVAIFSLAIVGAGLINLLIRTQGAAASCQAVSCVSARLVLPGAASVAFFAIAAFIARMFGPVLASAAEGFWLLDAPIERRRLLGGRLIAAVVIAGVIGAPLSALVALVTGSHMSAVGGWALAGGLGSAAVVAFAAAQQGAERTWPVKLLQSLFALLSVAALALVVAIAAKWIHWEAPAFLDLFGFIVAGVALVVLILAAVVAWARLRNIRRARLTSGGSLVMGMQGAMFGLDFGLMRDILVEREARAKGFVKPRRGRGIGLQSLILRDLQRLVRNPEPLAPLLVTVVVPYAVGSLGLGPLAPFIAAIVLCFALIPFLGMLRVLTRTPGLARSLPFSTSKLRLATMAVPASLAALWTFAVTPAFMGIGGLGTPQQPVDALMRAAITAFAGLIGAVRWQSAKQTNFNAPMLATGAGAFPPGMIANLLRGWDMVAIITGPLVFNLSPWLSVAFGAICLIAMLGSFDPAALEAQKAETERLKAQLDAQKKGPTKKIKLQR